MTKHHITAFTLLLSLGIIWGTGYSIARFAMTHDVPPLGYSFWQSLGPAIFLSIIALARRERIHFSLKHLRYYLICGLTGIVIPNSNMYVAASHLPAGLLAVIVNTVPIVAYPLALLARIEQFDWPRFFGILLALTGLMLIILPKTSLPSADALPWVLSTLITPCSFAFCAVYITRFRPVDTDSVSLAAGTLIAASILLLPPVLLSHSFYAIQHPFTTPDFVILLEIILSSIGYVLFFQLLKIAGPVYYSLVDTIVSLTGLFWGYMIFHETLNLWTSTAVILIITALIVVNMRQNTAFRDSTTL